jgi:hypothetical protein
VEFTRTIGGNIADLRRVGIAAKALNSIELDLLPLISTDVTRLHPRVQFDNASGVSRSLRFSIAQEFAVLF